MKSTPDIRPTPAQSIALARLRRTGGGLEVKAFEVYQPDPQEVADPRLARMLLVQVELGYWGDEADFRRALRTRSVYLVSPRGRVEPWAWGAAANA